MTKKAGDRVSLIILRDGMIQNVSLTLESKKSSEPNLLVLPPGLELEPPVLPPSIPPNPPSNPSPVPPSQSSEILKDMYNNCVRVIDAYTCNKIFGK